MELLFIWNAGTNGRWREEVTGGSVGSPLGPAPKVTSHSPPAVEILGDMKLRSRNSALQFQLNKC